MKSKVMVLVLLLCFIVSGFSAYAHSGRTDSLGGHNVKTAGKGYDVGTYHYHSGKYAGWIVGYKGQIPNPNKHKYDSSLVTDGSVSIIKPITKTPVKTPVKTSTKTPVKTTVKTTFSDIGTSYWASKAIKSMVDYGIVEGYPDGTFKPNTSVTREQFAKLTSKFFNLSNVYLGMSTFTDVLPSRWSYTYVEVSKKYLTGYLLPNGKAYFEPDMYATREDIAVALVKALKYEIGDIDNYRYSRIGFKDFDKVSPKLSKYIVVAVEQGLIKGYPDNTFKPQKPLTRAESVQLFYRILKDTIG